MRELTEILTNEFYTNLDMSTRSDAVCDASGEAEARWWRRPTAADCFYKKTTLRLFNQRQEASPPPLSIRRNVSKKKKKQAPSRARAGWASPRWSPRRQTKFPSVVRKHETTTGFTSRSRRRSEVKVLLSFLPSLLIGSGLHRMKLARKLLAARALLVLAANCWVCFQV